MARRTKHLYQFESFTLDVTGRNLLRDGNVLDLTPKAFETLLVLVESNGHVLEKEALMRRIWPDNFVEEATLAQNIFTLRRMLGKRLDGRSYIETIPKRGYRFTSEVRELWQEEGLAVLTESAEPASLLNEAEPAQTMRSRRKIWNVSVTTTLLLAIGLAIQFYRVSIADKPSPPSHVRSLAVLPFESLRPTEVDQYLGLCLTDTLITRLSNVKEIAVRPTSAVLRFNSMPQETIKAGTELGVDYLLEGSIQKSGDRIRVTVRLLGKHDWSPLWAGQFDEQFSDIFTIQDVISEQVAQSLLLQLNSYEVMAQTSGSGRH